MLNGYLFCIFYLFLIILLIDQNNPPAIRSVHQGNQEIDEFTNYDLTNICTPIQTKELEDLLIKTNYDPVEAKFLLKGFRTGFSIGYKGPMERKDKSDNIPFTPGVGSKLEMWNKIMKEVKMKRYAGPFTEIPFTYYVQSPIRLVPKAGDQTRLIFHLSYKFKNGNESINFHTPKEKCSVHYNDVDHAINNCLIQLANMKEQNLLGEGSRRKVLGPRSMVFDYLFFGKMDLKSAFRWIGIKGKHWFLLIMKAYHPVTGKVYYFVDKCLPFGASISCSHFQRLSNALRHIVESLEKQFNSISNYLDDFIFIHFIRRICEMLMNRFMAICKAICFPVADEKTEWPCAIISFLGMILNGKTFTLMVPPDKKFKAINLLNRACEKQKLTVKEIQQLTGILNFLNQAIVPGRVFARRMYVLLSAKTVGRDGFALKQHHHVALSREFKNDCRVWTTFLENQQAVNRSFADYDKQRIPTDIGFYSDLSKNAELGFGCYFRGQWLFGQWELNFIKSEDPSIAYLELFALCAGILAWGKQLKNQDVLLHCDNQSVVQMVNGMASRCRNCMYLLRLLALDNLMNNRRIHVVYIASKDNYLADYLSRLMIKRFWQVAPQGTKILQDAVPGEIWPLSKIWQKSK